MPNLSELIESCIRVKEGNKEFVLTHGGMVWEAGIGNPSTAVSIGEINPEFGAYGSSPDEAVSHLLELLVRCKGIVPDIRTDEQKRLDAMSVEEFNAYQESIGGMARKLDASKIGVHTIQTPKILLAPPLKISVKIDGREQEFEAEYATRIKFLGLDETTLSLSPELVPKPVPGIVFAYSINGEWNGHRIPEDKYRTL